MKHLVISVFTLAVAIGMSSSAWAEKPGTFGIGIGAGTISSGLSGKYYMPSFAIQANVGTYGAAGDRYGDFDGLAFSVDALLEQDALFQNDVVAIEWNLGIGGGLGLFDDTLALAAAGVIGLEFNFVPIPIDFVVEYRPTLLLSPDVHLEPIDFTGHLRFYFQ